MITPGGEAGFVRAMIRESTESAISSHTQSSGNMKTIFEQSEKGRKRQRVDDACHRTEATLRLQTAQKRSSSRSAGVLQLGNAGPRWYTSMLGKMGSVVEVVEMLKECGVSSAIISEHSHFQFLAYFNLS